MLRASGIHPDDASDGGRLGSKTCTLSLIEGSTGQTLPPSTTDEDLARRGSTANMVDRDQTKRADGMRSAVRSASG
jgi:hypothetical protein